MRYALLTHDLTEAPPSLRLEADQSGVAILVRRDRRPLSFLMHELPPSTTLDGEGVGRLIGSSCATEILEDRIRTELAAPEATTTPPTLTVAICTRARLDLLEACLASVMRLRSQPGGNGLEILVVDNAPPDDSTRRLVAAMDGVAYAREPVPGLDLARNRALSEAATDFVAFVDDDVEVDPWWLAGFHEAVGENPDAVAVTGLVLPHILDSEAQIRFEQRGGFRRGFAKLRYRGSRLPGNPLYPAGAGMFGAGCNMAFHRQTIVELGGFDEALDTGPPLPGGGDLDIFYRVVAAGHPLVYEPQMLVFHKHRQEYEQLRRQYWTWGTGLMAYVAKTYAAHPENRAKLRDLIRWWIFFETKELKRSLRGKGESPPDLVAAEFAGGLMGAAGMYARSRRRIERLKRQYA